MAHTQTAPVPVLVVGGGWLDDSQFGKFSPAPTPQKAMPKAQPSLGKKTRKPTSTALPVEPDVEPLPARSFQEIIQELIANTPPLPPPPVPPTPPLPPPSDSKTALIIVGIIVILIVWLLNR